MEYNEQFIRLNCSLLSDYSMMKLNAEMKSMGIGLYMNAILFLRKQPEYKHDFNKLDLLADLWGTTVETLRHLILDFGLFILTDDGYFRCIYLDEVMDYQHTISEQRAAAGSKGGKSSKRTTAKTTGKASVDATENTPVDASAESSPAMPEETFASAPANDAPNDASNYPANDAEYPAKSSQITPKNTAKKNVPANESKNTIQISDNEVNTLLSQASDKQNFKREEKNRKEKKKKDDVDIIKENIDEAFASQIWPGTVGIILGLNFSPYENFGP